MEARKPSRRSLSAEESRFAQRLGSEDVILGCDDGSSYDDSHPGNGYFRGLLLQRSLDFKNCLSEDERVAITWLVMAKITDRGGRFLTLIDVSEEGRPLYVSLEKSAVLDQIRTHFDEFSSTPMARKKPRLLEGQERHMYQPSSSPELQSRDAPRAERKEDNEIVVDDDNSSVKSKMRAAETPLPTEGRDEPSTRVSTPEPSVSSTNNGPAVATPDHELPDHQVSANRRTQQPNSPEEKGGDEKKELGRTTRMIVKQLRALHQEVAGLKKDRSKLFNEVLNLRDECGHLRGAMMDYKQERMLMHREIADLRKMNHKFADALRNRSPLPLPPPPPPDTYRPKLRPEYHHQQQVEDDLQKDLTDLKKRLQEQQRLTESLLGEAPSRLPMPSRDYGSNMDPSLLMGVLGARSPIAKKRHFPSDQDLERQYLARLSEAEKDRQGLKRPQASSPWS
jgi:hypothetical protein